MKINLVTGASIYEAAVNTIKQIDVGNFEMENLIVVPDSFSMQAESLIFDTLDIKSTFNIEVVGISRLAAKILRANNIAYKRISGLEEIFNIYKAVKFCEKDFLYFSSCGVEFCLKILQIIKQLKACKIQPSSIKPVGDEFLDKKMHDLKLIYEKYQELLGEQLDLTKLLDFFLEKAENQLNLSKINLFFVNFDCFSLEINSFICKLAKQVNSVYIGMAKPLSIKNAFIFEDDIFKKTTKLAKENNLTVETLNYATNLSKNKKLIAENLFSFTTQKCESDYFLNVLAKNRKDEVEFVAKYIKKEIINGARYDDFAIATADEKYFEIIKSVFSQFGIACYLDDAINLGQTILGRFLFKMFEIAKLGFSTEQLEYLASSPLLETNQDILKEVQFLKLSEKDEFVQKFPCFENIVSQITSLSKCETIKNYTEILKEILLLIEKNYQNMLNLLENEQFYKKQSENAQAYELILKVFDKLKELGQNEKFSLFDFENLLKLAFKSVKVETIPTYIDAVYIGDATNSYFQDVKTLFVLGATAGALPKQQNDTGIIDDDDIKKLRLNIFLEPEIKVINRRNRIKLFEMLLHANEKLIVCMPSVNDGKQSMRAEFVDDLISIFGKNTLHTGALEEFGIDESDNEFDRLLFLIGCRSNLGQMYSKLKNNLSEEFLNYIKLALKEQLPYKQNFENVENHKLEKISASELECYFTCPFKHYLQYVLKISPKEDALPNKRLYGIYQHDLLKTFLEKYPNAVAITEKDIKKFLDENVVKIAKKIYHETAIKDASFVKFLKNESGLILKNVIKEQKLSSFRPILLEEKIVYQLDDVTLIGYADRVDKYKNYFRIFDYKTGETKNLLKELYYGKKLQLFIYALALKDRLKLDCAGVYYFDCKTKFSKGNGRKLLNGITLKNNDVVLMTDSSLDEGGKSELLGMQKKSKPKADEFAFKYGSTQENFEKLFEYAKKITKSGVQEISEGYIAIKPINEACSSCPYISICKHEEGFRKF